jgi:hypothetical protein
MQERCNLFDALTQKVDINHLKSHFMIGRASAEFYGAYLQPKNPPKIGKIRALNAMFSAPKFNYQISKSFERRSCSTF